MGPGKGNAYVTNVKGLIYNKRGAAKWKRLPGRAKDIGVGAEDTLWVIGTNKEGGGFGIFRWNRATRRWKKIPGSALRISVDSGGNAWVVNKYKQIYAYSGTRWIRQPGAATDIGVGPEGSAWVIGTESSRGGGTIWRKATGPYTTKWATMTQ